MKVAILIPAIAPGDNPDEDVGFVVVVLVEGAALTPEAAVPVEVVVEGDGNEDPDCEPLVDDEVAVVVLLEPPEFTIVALALSELSDDNNTDANDVSAVNIAAAVEVSNPATAESMVMVNTPVSIVDEDGGEP